MKLSKGLYSLLHLEKFEEILAGFEPITLSEMDNVALLSRIDTKFVTNINILASVLEEVSPDYRVLEIDNRRYNTYETIYYDTEDLRFYHLHHRGKTNRYKFRQRKYVESDLSFMEIKFKNNKKRTIKNRIKIQGIDMEISDSSMDFVHNISKLDSKLQASLVNGFTRITLVNKSVPERLTIDLGLRFISNDKEVKLEKTVIIEAKQEVLDRKTSFMSALKRRLIRPTRISKYCIGLAMTDENLKSNNFKQRIKKINLIEYGIAN